jgi:hypothetical protein
MISQTSLVTARLGLSPSTIITRPKVIFHLFQILRLRPELYPETLEIVVFPFLNQKLDFSHEIEQHKVIHAGVDEVIASIRAAKADPTKFDPSHVKDLMQKLREPLASVFSVSCPG